MSEEIRNKYQIINGLAWTFIVMFIGYLIYYFGYTGNLLWVIFGFVFVILNLYVLYKSIKYIETYDKIAIGLVGIIIPSLLLLVVIALLVVLVVMGIQSAKNQ